MGTWTDPVSPWFSDNRSNHFSLGGVLIAVCSILASPMVDDPLVPDIAETYITDHDSYLRSARLYTRKYALSKTAPDKLVFADDDNLDSTQLIAPSTHPKTGSAIALGYATSIVSATDSTNTRNPASKSP